MHSSNRVQFEKPDLPELTTNNIVVDMHFHSTYSDGLNGIDKIAQRARKLGIGIAITDHNEIRGAVEIDRHEDLLTIPGIELTVAEGSHLLLYFYTIRELQHFYEKEVVPYKGHGVMSSLRLTMSQAIERARDYQCVIIFPHPYCAMYTGVCNVQFSDQQRRQFFHDADGVEVINANNLNKWNLQCAVLGFNLDRSMVGGSDGHSINHMGRAVTYADCSGTRQDFLDAIMHKANHVAGKEIALWRKMTANSLKLRSNLNNCPDLIEKNLRYGRKVVHFKSRAIRDNVRRRIDTWLKPERLRGYFEI